MWDLDHKESWAPKNWCFPIVVLEKTLESPLDCKEIQPVDLKENQPWVFIRRSDAEVEAPILWPPDVNWLPGKDSDTGKDWGQDYKGLTEDEMVGWHHWLNGHESEQTSGDSGGERSLECCSPWGYKELDMTEWLNNKTKVSPWPFSLDLGPQLGLAPGSPWAQFHRLRKSRHSQAKVNPSTRFLHTINFYLLLR